ncbi:unnamed protein product [Moneuplotes crassus]|uniref:DNA ligase n=1 Tax=Euplotes crassus TaxID=5936 RepID=A0AAD1XAV6_EUPCR|nr:unnamed protein product [Moneuplotes crassus]
MNSNSQIEEIKDISNHKKHSNRLNKDEMIPLNEMVKKSREEIEQDEESDQTEEVDQDTVVVEPLDHLDDDLPAIDPIVIDAKPREESKYEEDKESGSNPRRSRKRKKLNDFINGEEFDSSEEEVELRGNRKLNRQFQGVMLAEKYKDESQIDGWIMSEKLDGVRCIWNGKTMKTRNNNAFYPPDWFKKDFPDEILDGELWMERGKFQETVSIVRKSYAHDGWKDIKFVVFDGPELGGSFKTRLRKLAKIFKGNKSEYIEFHKQEVCEDKEHLDAEMKRVVDLGGEGMMIRDPNSFYEYRRSDKILKVKQSYDAEAVVLKKIKGTGRCYNMMGALFVRNNEGIEFKIGSGFTDQDRRNPPKIGSIVTYKYYEKTKSGKPRFPIYLRPHPGM